MSRYADGEDIRARTFAFAVRIVKLCRYLEDQRGSSQVLSRQLIRSGTSVGANIEEAKACQSRRDFLTKCTIAQKEIRETHYWLRLLAAADILQNNIFTDLIAEADELTRIISAIIISTRRNMS